MYEQEVTETTDRLRVLKSTAPKGQKAKPKKTWTYPQKDYKPRKKSAEGRLLEHRNLQKYRHEAQVLSRVCPRYEHTGSPHSSQSWHKESRKHNFYFKVKSRMFTFCYFLNVGLYIIRNWANEDIK